MFIIKLVEKKNEIQKHDSKLRSLCKSHNNIDSIKIIYDGKRNQIRIRHREGN